VPYFEVDPDHLDGFTTLVAIHNAAAEPVTVRLVLWTDYGLPTAAYDLYLTGYDVQTLNLRDLFAGTPPPATGPGISPQGNYSVGGQPGVCDPPPATPPEVDAAALTAAHRGQPSPIFGGLCGSFDRHDQRVRGFATVDVLTPCPSELLPIDPGYFGPGGSAGYDDVLWGDVIWVDPAEGYAQSEDLVRLQADPEAFGPGDRTFYGWLVDGSGADGREPLPAVWGTRFLDGGAFTGGTQVVVWRQPPPPVAFECGTSPYTLALSTRQVVTFDEEENGFDLATGIFDPPLPPPVPLAAQRAEIDAFVPLADFGWLYLDLDPWDAVGTSQGYVASLMSASGLFSVGEAGTPLTASCDDQPCGLGVDPGIGRFCLSGTHSGDSTLDPGDPVSVLVFPDGCWSSSCTWIHFLTCSLSAPDADGVLEITAASCLQAVEPHLGGVCTADCNGGGFEECQAPGGLAAGSYTVRIGGLSVDFTVPSIVPPGGLCVGDPF
jgi:hypothetical protein